MGLRKLVSEREGRLIKVKPQPLKFESVASVTRKKRTAVYVAVIVRKGFKDSPTSFRFDSNRNDGGWYALIGEDRAALIREALAQAQSFNRGDRTQTAMYEVAVGALSEMVVAPIQYELVRL